MKYIKKRRNYEEFREQQAFAKWLDYHPVIRGHFFHPANGGYRNKLEAIKLKRMGVKAGVSDFFIYVPLNGFHGLFIEMKKKKGGALSSEQKAFLDNVQCMGYAGYVANGTEDAIRITEEYLKCLSPKSIS
jgi:VRR-NUC domain